MAKAARRLLAVHVTTAAAERNWSVWGRTYTNIRNALSIDRANTPPAPALTISALLGVEEEEVELVE